MMLTVFTPAYNRADKLPRLYESLTRQSCFDFEWLIVDDGSKDDTAAAVKAFTGEGKFPVRYVYKENGGKHTAHNRALEEARGDWFLCVDSDDVLAETAVADILAAAQGDVTGIAAYKTDLSGKMLSGPFPEGMTHCTMFRLGQLSGGEFTLAFSTAFARRFPFPVFAGERFVTESVVYDRMDTAGQVKLLPKVVTLCEYQTDGYSQNVDAVIRRNPAGYCLYFLQRIDLQESFKDRLVIAGKYWCFRYISAQKTLVYRGRHPLTAALGAAVGLLFRVYYKLARGI